MIEYRFLALTNDTHNPYVTDWNPMDDGSAMNDSYFIVDKICHDIKIEIRENNERGEHIEQSKGL